jgi:hypothetical protein
MAQAKVDIEKLKVLTQEFRVSHPHVFKPTSVNNSPNLNYSIEMLFDKTTTDLSLLQGPLKAAIVGKWGPNKSDWPTPLKMPIRDGDKPYGKNKEVKPEHKGMWVVRASSSAEYSKPHVVGRDPTVKLENESDLYPGCYARASLKAHAYTFADKDGVKFVLDAVQFIRDGKAMGGKKPADQIFGVIEGDAGDADLGNSFDETAEDEVPF